MIVRRIRIEGWRAFQGGLEIEQLDPRCNVIHAPNGTGKSTLLEALRRGLLDSHRARGQDVEHLRPWGTKLAPAVTIDFSHEGREYLLRKRFLEDASAELACHDGECYQPIESGDEATLRMRGMLRAESPARSLGDWRHAGLAQLLWAPQAGMALAALAPDVVAEIQERLGVELQQAGAPWEDRLEAEYGRHFTETGRQRAGKQAPPYVQAERRLQELVERRETLTRAWHEFHAASAEIDRLRAERILLEEQVAGIAERLRQGRAAAEQASELRQCRAECAARAVAAHRAYDEAHRLQTLVERLQAARASAAARREAAAARETALRGELEALAAQLREAEAEVVARKAAARAAEAAEARWALAERYHALLDEQRTLSARRDRLTQADAAIAAAEAACRECPAPADRDLARLREALDRRTRAQAQLDMASVGVTIEPLRDGSIEAHGAEVRRHELRAGEPWGLHATAELVLDWHEVGRLRISPPAEALQAARDAQDRAERELAEIESRLGTREWSVVTERQREAAVRAARLEQARREADNALEGASRTQGLEALDKCTRAVAELLAMEPLWAQSPPDRAELRAQTATAAAERRALDDAQTHRERLLAQFHESRQREQAAEAERVQADQELCRVTEELRRATAAGPTPDEATLRELAMAAHLAKAQLEAAERALADLPSDTLRDVERAEQEQASLAQRREQNVSELSGAEERLKMRALESPYAELAAVEEQIAELEIEVRAGQHEAAALRLLYETYHECRRDFTQHVSAAVEGAARKNLTEIFGREFGAVHLDEDLAPRTVGPQALVAVSNERVPLERLSGGEQEQVHFAVRLALAESLAAGERQLLVFDDALTATDPQRMARILRMLERAAERLQIVILTCHPERYRTLRETRWIDLEAAKRDGLGRESRELPEERLARTTR